MAEDQAARNQGKVVVHSIPPYAMAWTAQHISVAGPDKKVVFYTMEGMMAQQFDYFRWIYTFYDWILIVELQGTQLRRNSR